MTDERSSAWQSGFGKMPGPPPRPASTAAAQAPTAPEGTTTAQPLLTRPLSVVHDQAAPAEAEQPQATAVPETAAMTPSAAQQRISRATAAPTARQAQPRSVTGAQVRAHKVAAGHARIVADALAEAGVAVDVLEAELTVDRLHLLLRPHSADVEQVMELADTIADALTVGDVDCSVDGNRVHVWAALGHSQTSRSAVVWVPNEVREAVNALRAVTGDTVTTIVLTAFNRQAGADGSGLANLFPETAAMTPGPMAIAPRKRRDKIATPAQLWLYLQPAQEVTLDQAVARTRAGSRSALLTRILEAELELAPAPTT